MDIDRLFKSVFDNIVIRNNIFKLIRENNEFISGQQCLVFKNYNQCNIKWCVRNKQFNLLLYKISKEVNKRIKFTYEHFLYVLEHNTDLELLKQIFQIYPNLIPTTINEQSVLIEKCSMGNDMISLPKSGSITIKQDNCYKHKSKQEIIKYLMVEFKIKPTKQTLNNLCIDGENITMIKSMFDQGYFSIKGCGIDLVYCSLKANDFQFYKLILKNNPILKNEFQNLNNRKLNRLLVSTCNIEFYKYSFKKLLKDEKKIRKEKVYLYQEPILFHINQTAIRYGNMEIIKYLCNNFHLYPTSHVSQCISNIFSTIPLLNEDASNGGISQLELLKFFIKHPKFEFQCHNLRYAFATFIKYNKLDCLIYLKKVFGDKITICDSVLCQTLSNIQDFNFKTETFNWLISYNDGKTPKVNCSVTTFNLIVKSLSTYPSLPYKSILDFILLDVNCQITENDISTAITNYTFSNDIDKYEYLCLFIKNEYLKPSFPK